MALEQNYIYKWKEVQITPPDIALYLLNNGNLIFASCHTFKSRKLISFLHLWLPVAILTDWHNHSFHIYRFTLKGKFWWSATFFSEEMISREWLFIGQIINLIICRHKHIHFFRSVNNISLGHYANYWIPLLTLLLLLLVLLLVLVVVVVTAAAAAALSYSKHNIRSYIELV